MVVGKVVRAFLVSWLALVTAGTAAEVGSPRVLIGPNILVSRDGDVPHVELILAASPKTAKNLLGGAITATRPNGGWACRAYSSTDGGSTWKASEFPEQVEFGGGDPQALFTAKGTALFMALTMNKSEKGKGCASMHTWRSEDAGKTWLPATEIPCSPSWDHEQAVVDYTNGRFAGRIYIGALYGYPVYTVGVFRSDDDGRSWIGPVEAANGGGTIGINDVTPVVLSDGTLVMPYGDFQYLPDKRPKSGTAAGETFWTVSSTDGGVTFGAPQKVAAQQLNYDDKKTRLAGFGKFAADAESKKYRDRIYFAWEDARLGAYRILFTYSSDRGKTWSAPKPMDNGIPKSAWQFQPAIAVNKDGVVAVTWYDTRNSADGKEFDEYFAASVDGGQTFLPPQRVSSAPSNAKGEGNSQVEPSVFSHKDVIAMSFLSAASRWASGGDYMGLAADKEGVFHPFWADARSGTFQVYTAEVTVENPHGKGDAKVDASDEDAESSPAPPKAAPGPRKEVAINDKIEFIFDPTHLDLVKKQVEVPIRIKNVSGQPIYPPIRIEIDGFGFPEYSGEEGKKRDAENAPSALNSSNGKKKEGATFDFGKALGSAEALEPGAQTNPVVMRFQFVDPEKSPNLRLKVFGMVPSAP